MEGGNNMDWWLVGDQMWLDQVVEEIVEPDLPISTRITICGVFTESII